MFAHKWNDLFSLGRVKITSSFLHDLKNQLEELTISKNEGLKNNDIFCVKFQTLHGTPKKWDFKGIPCWF